MHESDTNDKTRTTPLEALNTRRAKLESLARADPAAVSEDHKLLHEAERVGHVGSYSRDLRTGAIRWSDETYRIFGHEPGEISPTFDFVASHIHPEDREKFVEANRAVAEEDKPYDLEYRIVRKGGAIRAVHSRASVERDPAGRPVRMFGAIQDITERKRTQEELRVLSARHEAILAEVPDIIAEVDANKVYTWINQAGLEFFGPEVLGKEAAFYFEGGQDTYKIVQPLFNGNPRVFYLESWQRRRDGAKRLLAWWCRALADAEGNVTGALSTARDITEHKRAEEALRESEEKFRGLFNNAPIGMFRTRLDGSEILEVNDKLIEVFGRTREEMLGLPSVTLWADPRERQEMLRQLKAQGRVTGFECRMRNQRGEVMTCILSLRPCPEQAILEGSLQDITERKQTEVALRESEGKYRALVEGSLVGIGIAKDNQILYANQSLLHMYGYDNFHEFAAQPLVDYLTPPSRDAVKEWRQRRGRGEDVPRVFEHDIVRRDGAVRTLQLCVSYITMGDAVCTQTAFIDITDRKRAEEALRESEEKYRLVFSREKDAIVLTDADSLEFLDVNEAATRLYGYSREEFLRMTALDVSAEPDNSKVSLTAGAQPEGVRVLLRWHRKKDGTVFPVEISAGPFVWNGRKIVCSIISDVTERHKAEAALRTYQWQLRSLASELSLAEERERRRIATSLHDHTCQSLVLARMKLEELLESASAAQAEACRGISGVLNDVIEGVRELTFDLSSPTLYRFGLEAALKELLEDKFGAEQGVEYDFSDDHEPKPLTEDVRVLLFQSVREVLVNILKHAGAHKVTLDIQRTDGSIRIAVTDDGIGFDRDEVSSLPARHRGFGLFSIQERLDCIGGVFEIDSRRGVGSRFTLVAPLKMESDDSGRKHDVDQNSARG